MTRTLRPHQQEAYEKVLAEWESGILRTAVVHPTGVGKGDLIAKVITDEARTGGRPLVLCHRAEVLDQLTARCAEYAPEVAVGRVQGARNQSRRPITMAMIQTVARDARRARLPKPSMVVIDECHRASADGYLRTLAHFGSFEHTRTLGLTATLVRGDRKGLGDVFESVADSRDIAWAVDEGLLVRPRGKVVVAEHLDLGSARVSRGDYVDADLGAMVTQDAAEIAKAWVEHAENRITIAFVPTVAAADELRDAFLAQGVTAEAVTGSTPATERNRMYARLGTGATRVLVNVYVLVEGFDVPAVSCVLQCRPTRLPGTYTQMVGRALRLHPGKDSALILDVVGASRHQKLMTLIDLSPSSEIDSSELDDLPCPDCGGYTPAQIARNEFLVQPCTCVIEPAERDPDGGRPKLLGPASYEDHDFFAKSELNWLFTHGGTRFLPCGDRMALLWPVGDQYLAGHCTVRGKENGIFVGRSGRWDPSGPLPLNQARQRAEEWALIYEPSVASRGSSWRKRGGMPSDSQVGFAASLGVPAPELMSKARLSDEISIALASRVLDGA
jgi:superfamily II DNA or RNA helicase